MGEGVGEASGFEGGARTGSASEPQPALGSSVPGASPDVPQASRTDLPVDLPSETDAETEALAAGIREFFLVFGKTVRAAQLYVQGNPLLHQFVEDLGGRLARLWGRLSHLNLMVHEGELRWEGELVYTEKGNLQDNIAFQLYRDGIRRFELLPGVEDEELRRLIDILRLGKTLKEDEDDLLTLMWNADFEYIRYEYVDVLGEDPTLPEPSEPEAGELPLLPSLELAPELQTPTLREDFEPSLYFLDEADVAHLQQELRKEWVRQVKRDVMLGILDQYEMGDDERRAEIVDILRQMLPRVLVEGGFGEAAYIVSELRAIADERREAKVTEEVGEIIGELSEPIVLEQLVRILEDGTIDTNSEALATLLGALRPVAVEILMQAIPSVGRKGARESLMTTLDRLASDNPALISRLVKSDDPRVASEAARIAGRLRMSESAEAVSRLLERPERDVRLAAVQVLVELRTSMAGAPLLGALDDESRDVRVAAAKGLAALKYSPAADRLERYINEKDMRHRDLTEQLAFFEAYAQATGDRGTRLLARMLNGRRFLWLRYPSQVRACAARALGLVGGMAAENALNVAARTKDPMVLSAVHAARREPTEEVAE
jgi:HEAT repeat protein